MIVHRATAQSCLLRPTANKCGGLAEKNGAEFLKRIRQCREIKRSASFFRQVAPIGKSKKPKSGINSRFVHLKPANEPHKQDAVNTTVPAVVFAEHNDLSAKHETSSPWLEASKKHWNGKWIWCEGGDAPQRNAYAFFRREFESAGGTLEIHISADSFYWLYIDGELIGRGPSRAHLDFYTFDTHSIRLAPGRHCIAVQAHHIGEVNATIMTGKAALLVEATLVEESRHLDMSSGNDWRAIPALAWKRDLAEMMSHFGFSEVCDLRKIPRGWTKAGFEDAAWPAPIVIGTPPCAPWTTLCPRDIPQPKLQDFYPIASVANGTWTAGEEYPLPSKTVSERHRSAADASAAFPWQGELKDDGRGSFLVLDFGRCLSGYVELTWHCQNEGNRVEISYDDLLSPDGVVNPERSYAHLSDVFHLTNGTIRMRTAHPRGFRYLMIDISGTGKFELQDAKAVHETYPFEILQPPCSGDAWLDNLYLRCADTLRVCTTDAFTDCASRERVQWTQDLYLANRVAFYAFGETRMMRRAIFQAAQNALTDGRINGFFPSERTNCAFASSSLLWLHQVADYWEFTGNSDTQRLLPTVGRLLDFLRSLYDKEGLIASWPSGQFWDWAPLEDKGSLLITNAVHIRALERLAAHPIFDQVLGGNGSQSHLDTLRLAAHRRFWDDGRGLYRNAAPVVGSDPIFSQQGNTMAVWGGICPPAEAQNLLRKILNPALLGPVPVGEQSLHMQQQPSPEKLVPVGTLWFAHFICETLFETGLYEEALEQIRYFWSPYDHLPNLPETRIQHGNTTLCHAWAAGPAYLLPRFHKAFQIKP